jgi:hypothetical protein
VSAEPNRRDFLLPEDFGIDSFDEWDGEEDSQPAASDILPPPPAKPPRPVAHLTHWRVWNQRQEWSTFQGQRALKAVGGEYLRYQVAAVYPDDTWDRLFESDDPREALAEACRLGVLHNLPIKDGGADAITPDLVRIAEILGAGQSGHAAS